MASRKTRWLAIPTAALWLLAPVRGLAGPATPPAPLPPPTGAVVTVSTVAQLQQAVAALTSNTTIVIAAGTYQLTAPLYING